MRQQEECEERREMARALASLSMMYDVDRVLFREKFRDFRRSVLTYCRVEGCPRMTFRHLVRDGRQRFVVFCDGRQWDFFEFEVMEQGGDRETMRAMLAAMSFDHVA